MSTLRLEQSILTTFAYFRVRELAITLEELYLYLWQAPKTTLSELSETLARLVATGKVQQAGGLYFLSGGEALPQKRQAAGMVTEKKIKRARRAAKVLRFVPFLRAVLVCNSVAEETANEGSDIDVLVIGEANRLYIVRFFANTILRLFGMRTGANHERDRICLSFYVDTEHLNLANVRVAPDDVHLAYWLHQMLPVYDSAKYYDRLLQANYWTKAILPNLTQSRTEGVGGMVLDSSFSRRVRWFWETAWRGKYGEIVENETKKIQLPILERRLGKKINAPGHGIVVDRGIIKLHENDSRAQVLEKWKHYAY